MVEDAADCAGSGFSVQVHIAEIVGDPASVYEDCAGFALLVEMGVEWSDDVEAFFAVAHLLNTNFFRVVENTFNRDRFHGPILLECSFVGFFRPKECVTIFRSNVNRFFVEGF